MSPIYGERDIQQEKPFRATLRRGIWTVTGSLSRQFRKGGVATAEIARSDGRILQVTMGSEVPRSPLQLSQDVRVKEDMNRKQVAALAAGSVVTVAIWLLPWQQSPQEISRKISPSGNEGTITFTRTIIPAPVVASAGILALTGLAIHRFRRV